MAISPLKHHYYNYQQQQHHQLYQQQLHHHQQANMPFSVNDILHQQNYNNGLLASNSNSNFHIDDSYLNNLYNTTNKKLTNETINSDLNNLLIIDSHHNYHLQQQQQSLHHIPGRGGGGSNAPSNLLAPCTPSPSIHSPTNVNFNASTTSSSSSNSSTSSSGVSSSSSFSSSTPNSFNDQVAAAAAYLNSYNSNAPGLNGSDSFTSSNSSTHSINNQSPHSTNLSTSPIQFPSQYNQNSSLISDSLYDNPTNSSQYTNSSNWYNNTTDTRLASMHSFSLFFFRFNYFVFSTLCNVYKQTF